MKKTNIFYPRVSILIAGLTLGILSGCGGSSSTDNSSSADSQSSTDDPSSATDSPPLSAFNLSDISVGTTDVKQMNLIWTSASEDTGIGYSVCQKDTSKTNDCNELSLGTDMLSATVTVESLLEALNSEYFILASTDSSRLASDEVNLNNDNITAMIGYFKADNTGSEDQFGYSIAISSDGSTLAIGAPYEDGLDDLQTNSGAVYLFNNNSGTWVQSAYIKASNAGNYDYFAWSIALSSDGSTLAVGAYHEGNGATAFITDDTEIVDAGGKTASGAVYLFNNDSGIWLQSTYIKASNTGLTDYFGWSLALSGDGGTLAVGAYNEDNGATGIITDGTENADSSTANESGAVYLFNNSTGSWAQSAYIKASNADESDYFGYNVALNSDGTTLAIGAYGEDNSTTGIITGDGLGMSDNDDQSLSGAVYLFNYDTSWAQVAYIKASNTGVGDKFGYSIALSGDGGTLAIGAFGEGNGSAGIITNATDIIDSSIANFSGAAYLFSNDSGSWTQSAYIKASNAGAGDYFGWSVALSRDGATLAVGAYGEDNGATGIIINGTESTDSSTELDSGAVYLFSYDASWEQSAYIKASNTGSADRFGERVTLSANGALAVSARDEDNDATGIITDGSESADSSTASESGTVYLY